MFFLEPESLLRLLQMAGIQMILALSLNLINGQTGQFSLGHAGFMAIGAYGSAKLSLVFEPRATVFLTALTGIPFDWSVSLFFLGVLLAGGFLAAFAGFLVGVPSLRLRGDYFSVVTLGFAEIIRVVMINLPDSFLGASLGLRQIPKHTHLGWIVFFVICTFILISNWVKTAKGSALFAIRDDEIAAQAVGIPVARYKIKAFVLSAFFAGVAGGLFSHMERSISPSTFGFMKSIEIMVVVVLGGLGSMGGSVFAALFLTFLSEALRVMQTWRMMAYSMLLMGLMILRPQGLFGKKKADF